MCCAALVGVAAGCGGSCPRTSKDAIAVVNGHPVSQAQFDQAISQYNRSAKKAGQQAIECCSDAWKVAVQTKIVPYLVQRAEFEQQAKKLGVVVTPKDIDAKIKTISDQYFHGSMKEFLAAAKSRVRCSPR